jgi:hypothetical protein
LVLVRLKPDACRAGFGWYRAIGTTIAHKAKRKAQWLTLPILAIGAEKASVKAPSAR